MAKEQNDFPFGTNPDGTPVTQEQHAELVAANEAKRKREEEANA